MLMGISGNNVLPVLLVKIPSEAWPMPI